MNKRFVKAMTPFLLSAFIMGCASNFREPSALKEQLQLTQDVAERYQIDGAWWKIYQDMQLNNLVDTALKNNIDLAKSAIDVNRALYQANLLGADLVPSFSGGTGASVNQNIKDGGHSSRSFSGKLGVSYEVDLWQRIADTVNAQEWEYKATIEDEAAAKLALVNNVVDAYYNLVYLNQAIKVTEKAIAYYQQISELVNIRHEYGKIDSLNPAQAKQSLLAARNNLLDLQTQQKTAEQTLRNLLNLRPADPLAINYPDLLTLKLPEVDLNVPLSVLANRPDLRAAESRLRKSFLNLNAAEKSWYPTVTLGASIDSSSNKARTAFDVPFASGNVSVDLPFLQWNKVKWNIKLSEAEYESVKLGFQQSLTTALNEVDTYYYTYANTKDVLENTQKKYDYDVTISQYYGERFKEGKGELSDWLNALNTETSSRISLINNRYRLIQYENMIYKAIAGRYTAVKK